MKSLKNYLETIITPRIIDCHCHLFDANGETPLNHNIRKIGFMDIWFPGIDDYTGTKSEQLYDKYIKSGVPSGVKLLATAPDSDQIIHIYEQYKDYIVGFGELKCYDWSFGKETPIKLPYKDLKWVYEVCKHNTMNYPIYIHYSLDENNYGELEQLFKDFPNIPFILCHTGIGTDKEYGFSLDGTPQASFELANKLSHLPNVYLDISYTATDFVIDNLTDINQYNINMEKCMIGTDVNHQQFISDNIDGYDLYKKQERNFLHLYKYFEVWNYFNYKKLFL